MVDIVPNPSYYGSITKSFRDNTHKLIHYGYKVARYGGKNNSPLINSNDLDEPVITGYIVSVIKIWQRAANCPRWAREIHIGENGPVEAENRVGKSRLLPDITFSLSGKGCPELIFEAKRLRNDKFKEGKYVGVDGMGCLVAARYAGRYDEGYMSVSYTHLTLPTT